MLNTSCLISIDDHLTTNLGIARANFCHTIAADLSYADSSAVGMRIGFVITTGFLGNLTFNYEGNKLWL